MRKAALIGIFIVVTVVGIPVFAATITWVRMTERYKGYQGLEQFVEIPQGASAAEIRRRVVDSGVVRDGLLFRAALWWTGEAQSLKAGEYRFDSPISAVDVVHKIARGDVYARRITFPEGLTLREMAKVYESKGLGRADDFMAAARNASPIADLDPEAKDLEGYLFPETYAFPRGMPASRAVAQMVERFRAVSTDVRQRGEAEGLTLRQVVSLAALIEKETAKPDERPLVAAVYRNRMKIGMAMQADPTVVYALEQAGRYDGNIHKEDLAFDSPYNTYKYPGLPPGPIAAPGKASLEAAVAPADVPYIYFVSRNDGSHVFARTLAEHDSNVRKFQIEFFRNQRAATARPTSTSRAAARSNRAQVP